MPKGIGYGASKVKTPKIRKKKTIWEKTQDTF